MFKNRKRKGFTLIELVIVIAIIGILAAIAIPRFTSSTDKARNTQIHANARTIASAVSQKYADAGVWSTDDAVVTSAGLTAGAGAGQYKIISADSTGIKVKYTWDNNTPAYTGAAVAGSIEITATTVTFTF